ncbi:MAG: nucleotidyltransferase family protein [Steroidobacteraceae bacterium]|nr:nucleotidyltransferase family protein [Steroidobacteraceae bacterium]MDW8258950.1 nucleotidyltransferase family protein [Gammaproteobacteria bacterium]
MTDEPAIHVIVLAAGEARRFGSPKQLARIGDRSMLATCIGRASQVAGHAVSVVLGAHAAQIVPGLRHTGAAIVINREWREGIASSIRAGIASLSGAVDAALLMLADLPDVTAEDLARLIAAWKRDPQAPAAAQFAGVVGPPAIFPRTLFRELAELRGDHGARRVLQRFADRLQRVPMPSAASDIDTPEDLLARDEAQRSSRPAALTQQELQADTGPELTLAADEPPR